MKKYFNALVFDPLFTQSFWMLASSVLVNVLNLVYWLFMVRKLSVEDYGILNALTTLLVFLSTPAGILQTVITRYVSKFMAHDRREETLALLSYFVRTVAVFLVFLFFFLFLSSPAIADFLRIKKSGYIHLIGLGLVFIYFTGLTMGGLAGFQKFNRVAVNNVVSSVIKLVLSFFLVILGCRVFGALAGFVFSFLVALGLSWAQLPKAFRKFVKPIGRSLLDLKEIYSYFIPVGLSMLCFFALTNMDVILVKHFFSPLDAGYYSVAQMVGKIVLFIPVAIGVVMFPKIVDSHAKNGNTKTLLKKCLVVVSVLCGGAAFFSLFFPEFILKALTRHTQPQTVALVKYFALSMGFFALVNIFMLYNLSLHRMRYIYQLAALTLLELIGICIFHASLSQVLLILMFTSTALFCLGILSVEGGGAVERP